LVKVAEKFREIFETILLKTRHTEPIDMTTVEQMIHEPTTEEIKMAIENGKAPGEDDITTELLRKSGKAVMKKYYKNMEVRRNTRSLEFVDPMPYLQKRGYK